MKHLFYFFGTIALLYEAWVIMNAAKTTDYIKDLSRKKFKDHTTEDTLFQFLEIGYLIWNLIGLFTSQWLLFLILLLMGVFIRKGLKWITWIDAFISFLIILFIILNRYHFHIDLIGLVL